MKSFAAKRSAQDEQWFSLAIGFLKLAFLQYNVRMITFEWNSGKSAAKIKKHGVSFEEAQSVFYDEFAVQFFDEEHSTNEERFLLLGMSTGRRLLLVCHCERHEGNTIRIISARKATRTESTFYGSESP